MPSEKFTAVIYATSPVMFSASPLFRLIRTIATSAYTHKMIVIWHCDVSPPPSQRWPADLGIPVLVKTRNIKTISSRFYPYQEIETDAVFSFDEDALLTKDEIDIALSVWREFPERIMGYPARSHYWDEAKNRWSYSSLWSNEYSMVLLLIIGITITCIAMASYWSFIFAIMLLYFQVHTHSRL